jgi:hypothetical protein
LRALIVRGTSQRANCLPRRLLPVHKQSPIGTSGTYRLIVPILVRDYLSGIAQEKQIADGREGVASCESMTVSPDAKGAR